MSYHIGIDLGGTNIAVGITNGYNEIVARNSRKTKAAKSFEALVADIAQTAKETVHRKRNHIRGNGDAELYKSRNGTSCKRQ